MSGLRVEGATSAVAAVTLSHAPCRMHLRWSTPTYASPAGGREVQHFSKQRPLSIHVCISSVLRLLNEAVSCMHFRVCGFPLVARLHMYVCMPLAVYVCMYVCMYGCMYLCMYLCVCTYVCLYVCM